MSYHLCIAWMLCGKLIARHFIRRFTMHISERGVKQIAMHIPHLHALSGGEGNQKQKQKHYHYQSLASTPVTLSRKHHIANKYNCTHMRFRVQLWGLTYVSSRIEGMHHLRLQAPSHAQLPTPAWEYTSYITHEEYCPQVHRYKHQHPQLYL